MTIRSVSSAASLTSFAQNTLGTWTAAGFLNGRVRKIRSAPVVQPENVALCLFLGYLEGRSGQRLFTSSWMQLLGLPLDALEALAGVAAERGWLVLRQAGDVKEVRFPDMLTIDEERRRQEIVHVLSSGSTRYWPSTAGISPCPGRTGLAAIQRVMFAVYDKSDELRLQANIEAFELATRQAGKPWLLLDVTDAFPDWMMAQDYRDAYFECPEDLAGYPAGELTEFMADLIQRLKPRLLNEAGPETVVALFGVGALFGLARVSMLVDGLKDAVPGPAARVLSRRLSPRDP
ncbi:MAG: hypothetical protein MZV65_30130 [Chromatiales bacterium]|nr:hypothetical protein [Chromatiales bacterium]